MATTIKLKNSVTTTNAPSSLVQGEVAINITDKKVWVGNAATTPIQLLGDGGSVNFTTVDTTNLQVTNIKAKDGTASATIANSTGVMTIASSVLTTTDINGGTIDGTAIGGSTAAAGAFTTLSASGAFSANGGATLGDASGDALTINSSAVSIPNGLNFDSNTLVIDATNNRVGVGTDSSKTNLFGSASASLQVEGTSGDASRISIIRDANTDLTNGGGIVLGASKGTSVGSNTAVAQNTKLGSLYFLGADGTNFIEAANISVAVDGTPGTNDMPGRLVFSTTADGASSPTERMRITSTGNVGIGTSSPSVRLHVSGGLRVADSTNAANYITIGSGNEAPAGGNSVLSETSGMALGTKGNNVCAFYTNNTEKVRITSGGDVGVGTTAPACRGDFRGTSGLGIKFQETSSGNSNRIELGTGSGIGYINADAGAGSIVLGLNVAGTERMRITSGGEVYIAGTTDQGAYNLQCNGTGVWGAGAYVNGSDERIKDNIAPLDSGLDVVAKLNPVTYKYKEDWSKDQSTQTGFIAQELLTALEGKNYVNGVVQQGGEYMSVAYQNIIPILTKAIQELKAELDATKAEVALLKSK